MVILFSVILSYIGFVLVTCVQCSFKEPLYCVSFSFVLLLYCAKDSRGNTTYVGIHEFPAIPNVITAHVLGSWVSDVPNWLFMKILYNINAIFTCMYDDSTPTRWCLSLCVTIRWHAICQRMNYVWGWGVVLVLHFCKRDSCSTSQCASCPVMYCGGVPLPCASSHMLLHLRNLY